MKKLPHIPHRVSRFLVNVSPDKNSLITDPIKSTLGYILVDYALTLIQSGRKVSVHIDDAEILKGIKAACSSLNIDLQYSEPSRALKGNWSDDFYPSQKAIKLGQQYLVLGEEINKKSILHTLMDDGSSTYLPIHQLLRSIPFALREPIIQEVESIQSFMVGLLDYEWLFQHIDTTDYNQQWLHEDLIRLKKAVNKIEENVSRVKALGLTDGELKRQNNKTGDPQVLHLFSAKVTYQEELKMLELLRISSDKNPLNAAQLIDFLDQQLIDARQVLYVFKDQQVLNWLDAFVNCHPISQELIRLLAIYNIHTPWSGVLQFYIASAYTQRIDYSASQVAYRDALFYLRSYIGNLNERLFISSDVDISGKHEEFVYILPVNFSHSTDNKVVNYQVAPSSTRYPRLDGMIFKQRLTDTELVHNARLLSTVLADRLPQVYIFLNKEHILISSRILSDSYVLDWLHINEFEQLTINSMSDSLMECFVDQSRTTHIITYGYLLDVETVSDWIFQTQIIEAMQRLGLGIINVELTYTNSMMKMANIKDVLHASLGD